MNTERVFAALGDETRLELVRRLTVGGPQRTLDLVDGLEMSRQAATKHLEILENAGLVRSEKSGREVLRSLDPEALDSAASWLAKRAMEWDERLDRLKMMLESD